jgi:hypothetical protein
LLEEEAAKLQEDFWAGRKGWIVCKR